MMDQDIERVLITQGEIGERLDGMAREILDDLGGSDFLVVLILKGALVFTADLLRRMPVPLEIETINVASYHGGTSSSGVVDFLDRQLPPVRGRSLLLIDDILDTGRTLAAVSHRFTEEGAREVRKAVLLSKNRRRDVEVEAHYIGFPIADEFVVGYGLDYRGRYRNLPYIGILKPGKYELDVDSDGT